jgi:hypothetical protein
MKILILFVAVTVAGCAQPPKFLAEFYDRQDPCQLRNNGGNFPDFCGASSGRKYIYNNQGAKVGYIKP